MTSTLFANESPAVQTRNCTSCKDRPGLSYPLAGFPDRPCSSCKGQVAIPEPDMHAIITAIKGRKGLRSKAPSYCGKDYTLANVRAYYVWRLARFHGGEDVTMPIVATTLASGDPWIKELDALADAVAKRAFRTNMAAVYRWRGALGYSGAAPEGLPASAYPGGPVLLDNNKPEDEILELLG
jgi:hypothetical protein